MVTRRKSYIYKVVTDDFGIMTGRIIHVYKSVNGASEVYDGSYFEQIRHVTPDEVGRCQNAGINRSLSETIDGER
jgi:hypothetical protein